MSSSLRYIIFFVLASAVFAQVGITEPEGDAIVPEATQEVPPMEFVDEEALQQANEDAHAKANAYLEKAGAGACSKLSDATAQEVKDNVKAQQAILDKMDKGANCHKRGQAAITTMKGKLTAAENKSKDAAKKYNDALNIDVDFGKRKFNSLTKGNCNTFFGSTAYTNAKKKVSDAKKKKEEAAGKVTQAQKDLKAAEDAAKADVKVCQCDTFKNHQKALAEANAKVKAANTKAWTEAAHLKCVLAGKTTNSCTVPPLPQVMKTNLAKGVKPEACNAWEGHKQCKYAGIRGESDSTITVYRNQGNGQWNAGCFMKAYIPAIRNQDYMLQTYWDKGSSSGGNGMWAFSHMTKGKTPHYYPQFDFGAYCWYRGYLYPYVHGSGKGQQSNCPCKSRAQVRLIMKVDGTVEYHMQTGSSSSGWTLCYTSPVKAKNVPYVVDTSIYQQGMTIQNELYVGKPGRWNRAP